MSLGLSGEDALLQLHYPLMAGARITGKFDLGEHEVRGRKRHELLQQMLFRVVGALQSLKEARREEAKAGPREGVKEEDLKVKEDKIGEKKRKPQGTLVNPYIKKRKVAGAKFD